MAVLRPKAQTYDQERILYQKKYENPCRLTQYIVTFCQGTITNIDIQKFLEAGLRIVRFRMSHVVKKDKLVLLAQLKKAIRWCCEKYAASTWPVAISIDLPNACIRTGYLHHDIKNITVNILEDSLVELTSEFEYWNKCDDKRIFIDDSFTLATITPGTEISIDFGEITMICTKVITDKRLKCKVVIGGKLANGMFVCLRGVRHRRPPISTLDRHLLEFVKEHELDLITIHSIRTAKTIERIRAFFIGCPVPPLIMCTICEQQGLDNIEAIINASDGIILAREFLAKAIINPNRMTTIQLYISSKCRKLGKPFYLSGNVMQETLKYGSISCQEISDVTNGILQGAGFVLKNFTSAANVVYTMQLLDDICRAIETISTQDIAWRIAMELKPPINAAEAAVLACALAVRQTGSKIVIVLTVSGWTAVKLSRFGPEAAILAVSANAAVARQLQLYRGMIPVIYQHKGIEDWYADMHDRINFAIQYGLKHDLIKQNQAYVVLRKASPTSAFCDQISTWKVLAEKTKKYWIVCPEHSWEMARFGPQPGLH